MVNKVEMFLEEIRQISGLKNAILCGITVEKRDSSAEFFLVTDKTYSAAEAEQARCVCMRYLPSDITAKVKIVKRVPDEKILKERIYE